ncbi:MAG: hypothetical protein Q8O92_01205 [Candidatus Latescibacter sp.]|nr:hypothetical protein [Candidatus Latescibacter sp.]
MNSTLRYTFSLAIFLFFSESHLLTAQNRPVWPKGEFPHLVVDDKLWIGTHQGLYQYHSSEDTWAVYGEHSGLPSNDIRLLLWDGEFLWAATAKGLSYGDLRLNKWVTFTAGSGPPSETILSLASGGNYVWAGTDRGAARFDKIIQEWETFVPGKGLPDSTVYDIAVDGDLVYFATRKGLAEYDTRFEKWRYYGKGEGIASDTIRVIHPTAEYLWLFTDRGMSRFHKKLHTSLSFTGDARMNYENIRDFAADNDQFWLAGGEGVLLYDPGSSLWRNYQEEINLPSRSVKAFSFTREKKWFATERGVALYDEAENIWRRYDRAQGLSSENYEAAASYSGMTFLINADAIDYFKPYENRWYTYTVKKMTGSGRSGVFPILSLDREKGSYIKLNPDLQLSASGSRFTYLDQQSFDNRYGNVFGNASGETAKRGDLKAQLSFPGGRTLNGFYNDTDFSRTVHGMRYKGRRSDLVQEINLGDVRYEQGKNSLIPSLGIYGSSALLEAGPKTERYKRSLVTARGWSGEKTTGFETDFFTGNLQKGDLLLRDTDYIRETFFPVFSGIGIFSVDEGSEKVYMDDGDTSDNTANTISNTTIAGIGGDFDLLGQYSKYSMDYRLGVIRFLTPVSDAAAVVIRGSSGGSPFESVLKKPESVDNSLVNRYFIGGMQIIPSTFSLEILDEGGAQHPLKEFGLDDNGDGRVDPERIDYREGILSFPAPKPFPSSAYDRGHPLSHYSLHIRFQTEIAIFSLKHNHLIRGSETCTVDGETLTGGDDYVLDYTSGALLIIKEGTVAEDSEIKVAYEYYRDSTENFNLAGAGLSPSDKMQMEVSYFTFDQGGDSGYRERYSGIDSFSEFRWQARGMDFVLTPQFARTQGALRAGNSMAVRTDASSSRMRLFSLYERYDRNFEPLFPQKFQLGNLEDREGAGGTLYPFAFLDVSADWSRERSPADGHGKQSTEENLGGKIVLNKALLPALSLSARSRTLKAQAYESRKETLKGEMEYQVPGILLEKIPLKAMRLYGVWRRSYEDRVTDSGELTPDETRKVYDHNYLRFDITPANLIQINTYYRGMSTRAEDVLSGRGSHLLNNRRKLFLDMTLDRLRGMNLNIRSQGEINESFSAPGLNTRSRSLDRNLQSSLRFFPGQWYRPLTPFTFEFNYQPSFNGYQGNTPADTPWIDTLAGSWPVRELSTSENSTLYQARGEWRPSGSLFLSSGIDVYAIIDRTLGSRLDTGIHRINQKVEYRPSMSSLLTLQYIRDQEEKVKYSVSTRDNPLVWLENRWNDKLQTKCTVSWLQEEKRLGNIREHSTLCSPLFGCTYRMGRQSSGLSAAEIRNDLSFTFSRGTSFLPDSRYNSVSNAFAMDCYPASVLILRLRVIVSYRDHTIPGAPSLNTRLEIRMTAQL